MKKIFSVIVALAMVFTLAVTPVSADSDNTLRFGEDGKFRILHICDIQDGPALLGITSDFIKAMLDETQPDLVVLGGDNVSGGSCITDGLTAIAIDRFMSIFEEEGVAVAMVYGNHDAEGLATREDQMKMYERYDCFVGCAGEDLTGCGNYNVPIYSNDGENILYNLWMFDSLSYNEPEENFWENNFYEYDLGGYGAVHKDQIDWYVETSNELKEQNGGQPVPSMMFQHIIVPEIFNALVQVPEGTEGSVDGWMLPEGAEGELGEVPCPPQYTNGQFDAAVAQDDVVAMFFGHDHKNSFVVNHNGIDLVTTPGVGFSSYGGDNRGVRVIDLDVNDLSTYETEVIEWREFYDADNNTLADNRFIINGNEFETNEKFVAFFAYISEYIQLIFADLLSI